MILKAVWNLTSNTPFNDGFAKIPNKCMTKQRSETHWENYGITSSWTNLWGGLAMLQRLMYKQKWLVRADPWKTQTSKRFANTLYERLTMNNQCSKSRNTMTAVSITCITASEIKITALLRKALFTRLNIHQVAFDDRLLDILGKNPSQKDGKEKHKSCAKLKVISQSLH